MLERPGFFAFLQHAYDRRDWSAGFDGSRTRNTHIQCFAKVVRVAQIRVGLNERFLFHGRIVSEDHAATDSIKPNHHMRLQSHRPSIPSAVIQAIGK